MEELKNIINKLKEIRTETQSKVSDEMVWDTGVRIYNSQQNLKSKQGSEKTLPSQPPNQILASDKQKKLLKQLKVKFDDTLTKKEATKLIEENLKK